MTVDASLPLLCTLLAVLVHVLSMTASTSLNCVCLLHSSSCSQSNQAAFKVSAVACDSHEPENRTCFQQFLSTEEHYYTTVRVGVQDAETSREASVPLRSRDTQASWAKLSLVVSCCAALVDMVCLRISSRAND